MLRQKKTANSTSTHTHTPTHYYQQHFTRTLYSTLCKLQHLYTLLLLWSARFFASFSFLSFQFLTAPTFAYNCSLNTWTHDLHGINEKQKINSFSALLLLILQSLRACCGRIGVSLRIVVGTLTLSIFSSGFSHRHSVLTSCATVVVVSRLNTNKTNKQTKGGLF